MPPQPDDQRPLLAESADFIGWPPYQPLPRPETTLLERCIRAAFAARVPGSLLSEPFRRPAKPRIVAEVEPPPLGDRVAGMALRAGHFLIGGMRVPIAEADFAAANLPPVLDGAFHGFTWLADLAAAAPAREAAEIAERITRAWLAANPAPEARARGGAWSIENAARRLLGWLVHAPLVLGDADRGYRASLLEAIEETARWLDRRTARAPDVHAQALAAAALVAAGLLLPPGKPRRLHGEALLVRALDGVADEEGGVRSRSPLAQADLLATLLLLLACYRAGGCEPPAAVPIMLHRLVPPLLTLANADGALGNWQGAGACPAERVAALVQATGARARPLRPSPDEARAWGYQRLASGQSVLVCDAAPPPLARHARCGCASTLAIEFSHGEHALIVNCGGAALAGGLIPARIEQGLRATAAHSTLVLGDANSTAVLIGGTLGEGVSAVDVDRAPVMLDRNRAATRLEAAHDGYRARFGLSHRRILTLTEDGTALLGEDRLEPAARTGRRGKVGFAIRFHLGPLVDPRLAANGHDADLVLPDGSAWRFSSPDAPLAIEESLWADGAGRPHESRQLVIEGLASRGGAAFAWHLRRIG